MPTTPISLTEHFDEFIGAEVNSGRYRDASEVVRDGLRLLEDRRLEQEAKLSWLRTEIKKGVDEIDRGEGFELNSNEEIDRHMAAIGLEAEALLAAKA